MKTGNNLDVLVVDDDEGVRSSFAAILQEAGYTTAQAADCLSAMEFLESSSVRTVVLDVNLPGLSGLWLLDELDDPPPVILITGHDHDAQALARHEKVFAFLQKPIPPPLLLQVVARSVAAAERA